MNIPPGTFAPGGRTGLAKEKTFGVVPIQWIEAHPAARRFMAKAERNNIGAVAVTDLVKDLDDGFEGVIQNIVLLGKAAVQGPNTGIGWQLLFDGVPVYETNWTVNGGTVDSAGRFDYIHAGDGAGNSWGTVNTWIPQGVIVQMSMNNNGGTSDSMGWMVWGMYWPLSMREEWAERGWRGR